MPTLQRKNFATPDQVRKFDNGNMDVIALEESVIARAYFAPGWRWSVDVKPVTKTPSCQARHFGVCLTGALHVVADAGTKLRFESRGAHEMKGLTGPRNVYAFAGETP